MFLIESFKTAFSLIIHLNAELIGIIILSLKVSGWALIIATLLGLPLAAFLGFRGFRLKGSASAPFKRSWGCRL